MTPRRDNTYIHALYVQRYKYIHNVIINISADVSNILYIIYVSLYIMCVTPFDVTYSEDPSVMGD